MSQDNVLPYSKNIKIINFIKHLCSKENCEDKFWEMLDPSNYFLIINKLDKKYNLIRKFNWFNMEKLLKDVKSYSDSVYLSQNTKDLEIEYRLIFNNLRLGFIDLQFENNMKPFVKKLILEKFKERIEVIKEISNDEPFFNNYIYESINARHFKTHVLNTIEKLKKLINHKFDQLEEFCKVFNDLIEFLDKSKIINDSERAPSDHDNKNCSYTKLINLLSSKEFKSKYPNCFKKIYFILETCNKSNNDEDINLTLKNFFCINGSKDSNKKKSLDIITKLILFDLHMNDQEIMLNNLTSLGFNSINSYTMNFDEDKLLFLKLKFLIGFVRFLIHQIDKNLMKKLNTMNIFKISRIEFDFNKIKNQKLESIGFNLTKKDITFLEKLRFTYNYKDLVYLVREFFKNYLDLSVQEELLYLL